MSKRMGHIKIDGIDYYPRPSFHKGAVIISMIKFNPSEEYGGVWELFGQGKTLIGVDFNDMDYNESGKTGGEKYHILNESEMPSHNHKRGERILAWDMGRTGTGVNNTMNWGTGNVQMFGFNEMTVSYSGGSQGHYNVPPYITVYFYRRVS